MTDTESSHADSDRQHAADAGHGHDNPRRRYLIIWGVLLLFTVIEIAAALIIPATLRPILIATLLVFMAAKAGTVGAFYMHLIDERGVLKSVIMIPGVLGALYAIVLIREAIARW